MVDAMPLTWLWIVFTLVAALAQTVRNAMQKGLTQSLGTLGATYVRFLYGLPFAALSLAVMVLVVDQPLPRPSLAYVGWLVVGAVSQIAATALMLAAMRLRSFVVATAYTKTEALQVAVFALVFLSERLSLPALIAMGMATAGVWLLSWPKAKPSASGSDGPANASQESNGRPAMFGLAAGAMFAVSAVGFKGAIVTLGIPATPTGFILPATLTLVLGLLLQTLLLASWQAMRDPAVLLAVARAWRPSIVAGFMGAAASQMWFLAFALAPTAHVRSLGMIEVLFALAISRKLFSQATSSRDLVGIGLVVIGSLLLINSR